MLKMVQVLVSCVSCAGAMGLFGSTVAPVQSLEAERLVVRDDPVCPTCRLTLESVATLGDDSGPGVLTAISSVARLRDGRYVVVDAYEDYEIKVFTSSGLYSQIVGRRGQGPGEFTFARMVMAVGDEVHVLDPLAHRRTIFSREFKMLRTHHFDGQLFMDALPLEDGRLVINARIPTKDRVTHTLHILDEDGEAVTSLDQLGEGWRYDRSDEPFFRVLAQSSNGFWAAHQGRYQFDEWSLHGEHLRTIERVSSWFPDEEGSEAQLDPNSPPPPRLLALREDDDGNVWTLIRVPSDRWAEALHPAPTGAGPEIGRNVLGDLNVAYDTVIEVIDVEGGSIVASQQMDEALFDFVGDNEVAGPWRIDDEEASFRLRLLKVALQR